MRLRKAAPLAFSVSCAAIYRKFFRQRKGKVVIYDSDMATFALEYAQEHLVELFHAARLGQEVVIVREDGKSCELTPLAEIPFREASIVDAEAPEEPEAATGGLVPA